MWYVYILKSEKFEKYYIGYSRNLIERLNQHNKGKTKSIKHYLPMRIIYYESYKTKAEAFKRERQIKSYKGGRAFKELLTKSFRRGA